MQTKILISANAEVVTVHTLKPHDVYRRLEASTYKADQVLYGVVTDVANNGTDAFISALEFDPTEYQGEVNVKTFGTSADLALFSCLPDEFTAAAADLRNGHVGRITAKEAEVAKAKAALARLDSMVTASEDLTTAETTAPAAV